MRAVLMMVAVLRRRVIVRSAGIVVSRGTALRMPGMLLSRDDEGGRGQRQQPMPQNRQNGDPHIMATMSKQMEHL